MPANDFDTYWPPDASAPRSVAPLYPGVTIVRDQTVATPVLKFVKHAKWR